MAAKTVVRRLEDVVLALVLTCLAVGALGGIAVAGVLGFGRAP